MELTPEQRARLERMSHDLLSPANREAVDAALMGLLAKEKARAAQAEREREEALKRLSCMESHYAQLEHANEQAERTAAALLSEVAIAVSELRGDIDQRAIERETGLVIPALDRVIDRLDALTPSAALGEGE